MTSTASQFCLIIPARKDSLIENKKVKKNGLIDMLNAPLITKKRVQKPGNLLARKRNTLTPINYDKTLSC